MNACTNGYTHKDLWFFCLKVFEILVECRGIRVGRGARYIRGRCTTSKDTMRSYPISHPIVACEINTIQEGRR